MCFRKEEIMLPTSQITPQLNRQLCGPLNLIEEHFFKECKTISDWFAKQWQQTPPPVYGSVDLRNAGFKLAPIDMNLFPAGFNNLNPAFKHLSVKAARNAVLRNVSTAKNILVIPESHTRNLKYWENIQTLLAIMTEAGFSVRLGMLPDIE